MSPVEAIAFVVSWGMPNLLAPATSPSGDAFLGVLEKIHGDPTSLHPRPTDRRVWARVPFRRNDDGDWVPALADIDGRANLDSAPDRLPERIEWRACRNGRSLGAVISQRRPYKLYSEKGTHALKAIPSFIEEAPYDHHFVTFGERPAIKPFLISTLSDACKIGKAVRRADATVVSRLAAAGVERESQRLGEKVRLVASRGWQAGTWTVVELDVEVNGGYGPMVIVVQGDDLRLRVDHARVVDWVSADGDDVPDVVLYTAGYDEDGYVLVYGAFAKQVEFTWIYH